MRTLASRGPIALVLLAATFLAGVATEAYVRPNTTSPTQGATASATAVALSTASPTEPTPTPAPSPEPSATSLPPLADGIVPILYLHRVEAPPPAWSSWTAARQARFLSYDDIPAAFAAQLDWLAANGYTTILPRDLARHWSTGAALPPRPVIITLDDGSSTWIGTVLPLLLSHRMVAEFYVTLAALANHTITWDNVRTLARAGMGIGAHDVHHVQLVVGGREVETPAQMWAEIEDARQIIGAEVGKLPDSMAYVGGGFDATLVRLVAAAGYTTARSIIRGLDQSPATRFALRVIAIASHDDVIDAFTGQLVQGLPVFAAKMAGTRA